MGWHSLASDRVARIRGKRVTVYRFEPPPGDDALDFDLGDLPDVWKAESKEITLDYGQYDEAEFGISFRCLTREAAYTVGQWILGKLDHAELEEGKDIAYDSPNLKGRKLILDRAQAEDPASLPGSERLRAIETEIDRQITNFEFENRHLTMRMASLKMEEILLLMREIQRKRRERERRREP